ncbi:MAG: hypothetical protein QM682_04865 [Paracoccus sp. (in: a-proteobacteria)]|uniref:hypothetical protein n=1 Tax=Paracoccus sp. TaxID=267 RepID=UPI0039E47A0D
MPPTMPPQRRTETPPAPGVPERPNLRREETDLDRARDRVGGRVGDVTVTLLWNGRSDLDLVVRCPNGEELTGANSQNVMRCGGQIDVDANYCTNRPGPMGNACDRYQSDPVDNPVENAYFVLDQSMPGRFEIWVRHYAAARGETAPTPIPFVLQLRQGEERELFEGTARPGAQDRVAEFRIE